MEDASQVFSRGAPHLNRGNALTVTSAGAGDGRSVGPEGNAKHSAGVLADLANQPVVNLPQPYRRIAAYAGYVTSVRAEGDGTNPVLVASKRSCDEITEAIPDLDTTVSTSCGDQVATRAEGHGFSPGGKAAERSA
jgi:hypothetical protein